MENVTNSFEEYNDPELYDIENKGAAELDFILSYAGHLNGKVIELAAGTGRVAIPLAEKGINVLAVDIHEGMLKRGKEKSEGLAVTWLQQDLLELTVKEQSKLVYMVGNSFQHFLSNEEQNKVLKNTRSLLAENGIFIFNLRFPSAEELLQPDTEEFWRTVTDSSGNHIDVYTISRYNPLLQIQHYTTIRKIAAKPETKTNIYLRYTYPQELERLLEQNNFKLIDLYEDWNKTPLSEKAESMICVCRAV